MAAACNRNGDYNIAAQDHESSSVNKYGGIVPKKKPLISKDHERAFFDSADWALCKQGVGGVTPKTTVAMETLQPKLQRTPHQQLPPRRPACTSGNGRENPVSSVPWALFGYEVKKCWVGKDNSRKNYSQKILS